jgi:hypothetical protein
MSTYPNIYVHAKRFPKNAPGAFYTLGDITEEGQWCGRCLSCEIPELTAPTLLAQLDDQNSDTYFLRQPETAEEIEAACVAAEVCCVSAIRYGGRDLAIIQRLGSEYCDFASELGIGHRGPARATKRWWQFWK